jgi:hypothetical protein
LALLGGAACKGAGWRRAIGTANLRLAFLAQSFDEQNAPPAIEQKHRPRGVENLRKILAETE